MLSAQKLSDSEDTASLTELVRGQFAHGAAAEVNWIVSNNWSKYKQTHKKVHLYVISWLKYSIDSIVSAKFYSDFLNASASWWVHSEDTASLTELVSCQFARGAAAEVNWIVSNNWSKYKQIQTNTFIVISWLKYSIDSIVSAKFYSDFLNVYASRWVDGKNIS